MGSVSAELETFSEVKQFRHLQYSFQWAFCQFRTLSGQAISRLPVIGPVGAGTHSRRDHGGVDGCIVDVHFACGARLHSASRLDFAILGREQLDRLQMSTDVATSATRKRMASSHSFIHVSILSFFSFFPISSCVMWPDPGGTPAEHHQVTKRRRSSRRTRNPNTLLHGRMFHAHCFARTTRTRTQNTIS